MTKRYRPTPREVYAEMWNGVKDSFNKKIGKPLREFGYSAVKTGAILNLVPYVVPTVVRKLRHASNKNIKFSTLQDIGSGIGAMGGALGIIAQMGVYAYLDGNFHHPEIYLVPAATNVASGLYEIGRKMHSDARKRLLKKHRGKNLEALSSSK